MQEFDLHPLWFVERWSCGVGQDSHGLSIRVSREFLEAAKQVDYDEAALQKFVCLMVREAGYKISESRRFLLFGEWGLEQINVPGGDACQISLGRIDDFDIEYLGGTSWSSNNVDNSQQQSLLFAIWLKWAEAVEDMIRKEREEEDVKEKTDF